MWTSHLGRNTKQFCQKRLEFIWLIVTNYYFGEIFQYHSKTELLLVSIQSISSLISWGDSSCSWVLVCALDLFVKGGVLEYNAGWGVRCVGSSLRAPVPSQ